MVSIHFQGQKQHKRLALVHLWEQDQVNRNVQCSFRWPLSLNINKLQKGKLAECVWTLLALCIFWVQYEHSPDPDLLSWWAAFERHQLTSRRKLSQFSWPHLPWPHKEFRLQPLLGFHIISLLEDDWWRDLHPETPFCQSSLPLCCCISCGCLPVCPGALTADTAFSRREFI